MPLPTPAELAELLHAPLFGPHTNVALRGTVVDSRRVRKGDVFFALAGRHTDGHRHASAALEAGAAVAVVREGAGLGCTPRIEVPDPLAALQTLAAWHRVHAVKQVIAVTGSNGKTIVKDALTAILSGRWRVASSPGSWNSQLGVPLAVLAAPEGTEIGVFEAGISAPGEMETLARVLRPDAGVLVNVGLAHIAAFGGREATAREKMRLFTGVPASGWVVLPDDPVLNALPLPCPRVHPGRSSPHVRSRAHTRVGTELMLDFEDVQLPLTVHTHAAPLVDDLVTAMTAAVRLGVPAHDIVAALQDYSFGPTRMETWRTSDGVTIVNDAASSDPLSVHAALEAVAAAPSAGGRRIFVFGGMGELGERDAAEHALIGRVAAERGFSHLVLAPHPSAAHTAQAWHERRPDTPALRPPDLAALQREVRALARPGDTLLVKGPRNEGLAAAARELWESMSPRRFLVDLGAIRENVARFRSICGPRTRILAVLKAWAYGAELTRVATSLQSSGVDWIGVSAADEGAIARRAGVHLPILVMLMDVEEVDKVARHQLTPVVYSLPFARALADAMTARGEQCDVHLEIDTGMGRLGVACGDALTAARLIRASGCLKLTGVMTHLSSADDPDADDFTRGQLSRFDAAVAEIRADAPGPLVVHAAATAGAARFPEARHDMVRLGIGLYGIYPSPAVADVLELQLAVAFVSRLAQVAVWPRGQRVGYNGTYVVTAESQRIGIVEAGYNDGVPWGLSNRGEVLVHGRRVAVLGRVSMDSMAVDLTDVPAAAPGDEVLLFGAHDGQTLRPEEVARRAGSMPYELLVHVDNRRVQRVFRGD